MTSGNQKKATAPPTIRPAELTVVRELVARFEEFLLVVPDRRAALVTYHLVEALLAAGDLQNEGVKNDD